MDNTKLHSLLETMSGKTLPRASDRNSTQTGLRKGFWCVVEKSQDGVQVWLAPGARKTSSGCSFFLPLGSALTALASFSFSIRQLSRLSSSWAAFRRGESTSSHTSRMRPWIQAVSRGHCSLLMSQVSITWSPSEERKVPTQATADWVLEKRFTKGNPGCSDPKAEQMHDGWLTRTVNAAYGCLR